MMNPIHYENKAIVLTYHHIGGTDRLSIAVKLFKEHLKALQDNGYNVIGIDAFLRFIRSGTIVPNAVLLTFDDGWDNFYLHAYPELKAFRYPAVNFVIVSRVMKKGRLTWDQMREMQRDGIRFFSHSYDQHRRVDGKPVLIAPIYMPAEGRMETAAEYRERMKQDFRFAEQRLENELGRQPHLLCIPYGSYNAAVLKAAKDAGIELCFTTKKGINARGQYEIYRLNAGSPSVSPQLLMELMGKYG